MKKKQALSLDIDPSVIGFAEDSREFETHLVACCSHSEQILDMCERSGLCMNQDRTRTVVELEDGLNNALYLTLKLARSVLGTKTPPTDVRVLIRFAQIVLNGQDICGLSPTDSGRLLEHIIKLQTMPQSMTGMVQKGFGWWLQKKRLTDVINREGAAQQWDPQELTRQINAAGQSVINSGGKTRYKMSEGFVDKDKQPKRLLTGMNRFDAVLGGGCPYGGSMLAISVQGGGKSVWTGQLTSGILLNNGPEIRGLVISTEEDVDEFWARIVSNRLTLDYNLLKDGVDTKELPERKREEALDLARVMDQQLAFVKWETTGTGLSFMERLRAIIDDHIREFGRLDFLVFDWLGAALSEQVEKDSSNIRVIYDLAAQNLCQLARDMNFFCCYLAQANITQAEGRKKIRANHVAECKSLGAKAQIVMGISGIKTSEQSDADGSDAFETRQYLFFDKLRKARGKLLAVDREFHYMRFYFPNNEQAPAINRRPVSTT